MGYYINQNGGYYEGDKAHWQDQTVPRRPDANHTWGSSEWLPPPVSQVRAAKLQQLEQARKRAIDTIQPVTIAGKQYPATPEYREVITGIARRQAAGRPVSTTLRGLDGTQATLNAAVIAQVDDAITAAVQAQWDKYWQKYDAVQAATTNAAVEAVVW